MLSEYVSLDGCELATTGLLNATKASPYSPMNRTQGFGSPSTIGILLGGIRSLYTTKLGARIHNRIGGSQESPQHRLGSNDPRVTSSQPSIPRITVGSTTRCNKCKRQEHTKWSNSSPQNPTKATNAMEGFRRKNKGETLRTPKSRSHEFPPLRGDFVWWKGRSRSPLLNA